MEGVRTLLKVRAWRDGQAAAVASVLAGHNTVFVTAPGGGKTAVVRALAVAVMRAAIIVIVAPFAALAHELARRFDDVGGARLWTRAVADAVMAAVLATNEPRVRVVVVTVDAVVTAEFEQMMKALLSTGRLAWCVLDEAHVYVLDATWRVRLSAAARVLSGRDVAWLLLSGTMPRVMLDTLFDMFGIAGANIVTGMLHRAHIRYVEHRPEGGMRLLERALTTANNGRDAMIVVSAREHVDREADALVRRVIRCAWWVRSARLLQAACFD